MTSYCNSKDRAYFWSSTKAYSTASLTAGVWVFRFDNEGVESNEYLKKSGFSVRCLRDTLNSNIDDGEFTDPHDDQTYITVNIVYQTWLAENCYKFGLLYTWAAAPKAGTCPPMRNGTLSEILPTTAMT